jgi:uncharacterized protein YjiS (DUF1127 family)
MTHDLAHTYASAEQQSQAGILARTIDNWRARKAVRELLDMEDHLLADMGVYRADVAWAAQLPLSQNAVLALDLRTRRGR